MSTHQVLKKFDKPTGNKSSVSWRIEASKWSRCWKTMQDMDCIKVDMRILVASFDMEENHALGQMQNLASERHKK